MEILQRRCGSWVSAVLGNESSASASPHPGVRMKLCLLPCCMAHLHDALLIKHACGTPNLSGLTPPDGCAPLGPIFSCVSCTIAVLVPLGLHVHSLIW